MNLFPSEGVLTVMWVTVLVKREAYAKSINQLCALRRWEEGIGVEVYGLGYSRTGSFLWLVVRGGSACLDSLCQFISGAWRFGPMQWKAVQAGVPSTRDRACVCQPSAAT